MKFQRIAGGTVLALALCGCVSPNVEITVSSDLEKLYGFRPSLEVDVAATGGDEVKRAQGADMDKYFQPESVLRSSLSPETLTFSMETDDLKKLPARHACWKRWDEKSPNRIFLFVNLPSAGEDPKNDARRFSVEYSKSFLFADTLRFRVTPAGIVQVK